MPLRLEITDPRGIVVRRETYLPGAAGFGEILHATKESSPTGTYTLSLSIVRNQYDADLIGSTTVQVRDFQPDRLRMKAGFSTAIARRLGRAGDRSTATCTSRTCSARRRRIAASPRS